MCKVSIIIPVYNAGEHLRDCLDSLVHQTLVDIEILLVLDCPTDGSDKVCREYARKDARIKILVNDENLHIGLSRNRGLDVAQGEYIAFSDDDDYREPNMYESLYRIASNGHRDMVIGLTVNEEDGHRQVFDYPSLNEQDVRDFALQDLIACGGYRDNYPLCINIHPHLYKRSVIERNHIRFVDTRKVSPEDRLFNIEFLLAARNVALCRQPLYYHRIYRQSTMHTSAYLRTDKVLAYMDEVYNALQNSGTYVLFEPQFFIGAARMLTHLPIGTLKSTKSLGSFFQVLREMGKRRYIKKIYKNYPLPYSPLMRYRILEKFIVHRLSK